MRSRKLCGVCVVRDVTIVRAARVVWIVGWEQTAHKKGAFLFGLLSIQENHHDRLDPLTAATSGMVVAQRSFPFR